MDNLQLTHVPVMKTGMLIRKTVAEVFEAFIDPDITTQFWFTLVLAGLEALLEHKVRLNLVGDRYPKGLEEH